jgi:hypothetical protein
MGSPHIGYDGIYARSEAEVLIKKEWERHGRKGLEEILETGKLERRRNDDKVFFAASDLADLDLDPEGKIIGKEDALEDISRHLDTMRNCDFEP